LIKHLYSTLRGLIILAITLSVVFILLISHKSVLPYLAQKYLSDYGITYSNITGSLVEGVSIYDLNYENAITIKSFTIKYNPFLLLRPTPKISLIETNGLKVDANYFKARKNGDKQLDFIDFEISTLTLMNSEISYEDKDIKFDAHSKNIVFQKSLHVNQLRLENTNIKDPNREIKLALTSKNIEYKDNFKFDYIALKGQLQDNLYGNYKTDFNGTKITYKNELANIKNFTISLQSPYGQMDANASLKDNNITAKAKVTPKQKLLEKNLDFLADIPKKFNIDLNASTKKVAISTTLETISPKEQKDIIAKNTSLHVNYEIDKNFIDFVTNYDLFYKGYALHVKQFGTVDEYLNYQSSLKSKIFKAPIKLPLDNFDVTLDGNTSFMNADINSSFINIKANTHDFNNIDILTNIKNFPLNFIDKEFKDDVLFAKANSKLQISPFALKSSIEAQDQHISYIGDMENTLDSLLFKGDIQPKLNSKMFENINPSIISDLNFVYFYDANNNMLNIDANRTNITIFEKNKLLNGWGNLDDNNFRVSGNIDKTGKSDIKLFANFPSIKELLDNFKLDNKNIKYDAEVNLEAQISYDGQIELKSLIEIPWYYVILDDDTSYAGQNLFFEVQKEQNDLLINKYEVDFLDHKIYSNKPSTISLDSNQTIQLKELWVYDNLLVKGDISTKEKDINLKVKSEKFSYNGVEGNITAKADISLHVNDKNQVVEGYVTLLDGLVKYIPKKSYSITDKDIIIIQEINDEVINNRFINLKINSLQPIDYKIKNINLKITPDFTLFKSKGENMTILGLATINQGEVTALDKLFTFDKSEVYFYEDNSNPMLNLNIKHQTLDYKDIDIYITGKLASPVIIFSSKQSLSQDDIMSYVLFGEPSSNTSSSSTQTGNKKVYLGALLLGTQLKQILNNSNTLKIDTLNILTTEEGSLGYEIGSRINKDLRIIYKNNVVSSVIVQYNINRSVRVDVDVNQESQGVSVIYTKDF